MSGGWWGGEKAKKPLKSSSITRGYWKNKIKKWDFWRIKTVFKKIQRIRRFFWESEICSYIYFKIRLYDFLAKYSHLKK